MSLSPNEGVENNVHQILDELVMEIGKVVIGREKEIKLMLTALLSEGHVLLEDLPGTGKTTLVKAFARGLNCEFSRVQGTPDLLPTDILGGSIFNPKTSEFQFRRGPIFTNILLVDEINRTLPRTQSSLLESMEERQVSVEGQTHFLENPFLVLATQNPVDMEGTFPLPEAQLDRFLMRLRLGYPTQKEEELMLEMVGDDLPFGEIRSVINPEDIRMLQIACREVHVHASIREYIILLANATRQHPLVQVGVSPRASKALFKTVKVWALLNGRSYVTPDDVKVMVNPVWNHRLRLKTEAQINQTSSEGVLEDMIRKLPLPEEKVLRV